MNLFNSIRSTYCYAIPTRALFLQSPLSTYCYAIPTIALFLQSPLSTYCYAIPTRALFLQSPLPSVLLCYTYKSIVFTIPPAICTVMLYLQEHCFYNPPCHLYCYAVPTRALFLQSPLPSVLLCYTYKSIVFTIPPAICTVMLYLQEHCFYNPPSPSVLL